MATRSRSLRLIRGGRRGRGAGPRIVAAPRNRAPFPVDAVVEEEDTWLVLSAPAEVPARPEHPLRLMTALWEAEPLEPGTVVVRPGTPLRMLAVVHDLERQPTWEEAWVAAALEEVLRLVDQRSLHAVAMPPLGARHGDLDLERFTQLLHQALERRPAAALERLWLMLPDG